MHKFANNRVVLATFAILMAIGLTAAYIPLIFSPNQNPPSEASAPSDNNYAAQLPKDAAPVATTTVTSTIPAKASLFNSFSGLQDEQKSLDDLNNLLK